MSALTTYHTDYSIMGCPGFHLDRVASWLTLPVLTLILLCLPVAQSIDTTAWRNDVVRRTVDLRGHIEEQLIDIDTVYSGAVEPIYYLCIPLQKAAHLSLVQAYQNNDQRKQLNVAEVDSSVDSDLRGCELYSIEFPSTVRSGENVRFTLHTVYTRTVTPYPAQITHGDNQLVLYTDSVIVYSLYPTRTQQSLYKLPSTKVESYTKRVAGVSSKVSGADVQYNNIKNIGSLDGLHHTVRLHYENNSPFITFLECVKEVEVSHWGNVAVEEHILMQHTGAELVDGFNRAQYETSFGSIPSAWRQLVADLPPRTHSVYYTDRIGNVSTSHVNFKRSGVHVELETRYPMYGGWRADALFGYSLPSRGTLYVDSVDSSRYVLNISFSSAFNQAAVDQLQVRIVLPEGARDIQFVTPFHIDSWQYDTKQTYLDTTGRPVLVLQKHNVVNKHHSQNFQVAYTYSRTALLWEPFLLISIFAALFGAAIVYGRIELSIAPLVPLSTSAEHAHKQLQSHRGGQISTQINQVITHVYSIIDSYIDRQPDSMDAELQSTQKVLIELGKHSQLTEITRELYLLLTKLRVTAAAYADAAGEQSEKLKLQLEHRIALIEITLRQLAYA